MTAMESGPGHPIGTEASKCPKCHQGLLFFVDCIGGKSMVLECMHCRQRFYQSCGCELFELNDDDLIKGVK